MRTAVCVWIALACVIAVIEACSILNPGGAAARQEGPQFDHAGHLARGLDCSDCHGDAEQEWRAMPELETCMQCHEEIDGEKPPEKRASAFYDDQGKGRWVHAGAQGKDIIFPHGFHAEKYPDCKQCHAIVIKSKAVPKGALVTMDTCTSCHEKAAPKELDCATCHVEIRQDRPPPSHRMGWRQEHGRRARQGAFEVLPQECSLCHTRSSCDTCHRAEKPRTHNNLWRLHGHAAMASMDRDRCAVCHTTDSCVLCHESSLPRTHKGAWGAPFDRHCVSCHLPLEQFGQEGCAVCHRDTPGHALAPPRPPNPAHMTNDPDQCRVCHNPVPHPDNGQSCLLCHQ